MAIPQISSGKKATSKSATSITAKKPLAKKATATSAKKVSKPLAAVRSFSADKTARPTASKIAPNSFMTKAAITPEERYKSIEAAAYLRAERRGFVAGHALEDWIAAEAEIDAMLQPGA